MGKFDNGSLWGIAEQSHTYTEHTVSLSLSLSLCLSLPISISLSHTHRGEREKWKVSFSYGFMHNSASQHQTLWWIFTGDFFSSFFPPLRLLLFFFFCFLRLCILRSTRCRDDKIVKLVWATACFQSGHLWGVESFMRPASRAYDRSLGNTNYHVDLQQTLCNYIMACREALRNLLPIAKVMRR